LPLKKEPVSFRSAFSKTNVRGWLLLLNFIPLVGNFVFLFFMLSPGNPEDNRFGPPAPTSPGK